MKNKILLGLLVLIIAGAGYFILKGKDEPQNKKIVVAFVVPTLDNPFFVNMIEGAKTKAKELNVQLIVQATQKADDAIGQNQIVENLITQKVNIICIVPINSESIIQVVKKANTAGIPVVNIDNKINMEMAEKEGAKIMAYIGSDNFEGGKLAGKYIVEKLEGAGNVAILEGVSGNDAAIKRKGGFMEVINGSPGIKIVSSQVANWNREQAFKIFQNILKANPQLDAVFCGNDEMALGCYSVLEQDGISKDKIVIVGFDAIKEAVDAVNSGKIDATVAQQPELMGEEGVKIAVDIVNNENFNSNISTNLIIITK